MLADPRLSAVGSGLWVSGSGRIPCTDNSTTRAEPPKVTNRDRRRDKRHRLDHRRLGRVAEGDVRRKAVEARLMPEFAHPPHVTVAGVLTKEGGGIPGRHLERFYGLEQLLMQFHELARLLDRHPYGVAALPSTSDARLNRFEVAQDTFKLPKQRVERLREDELLRQRDVRQAIGAEQQTL